MLGHTRQAAAGAHASIQHTQVASHVSGYLIKLPATPVVSQGCHPQGQRADGLLRQGPGVHHPGRLGRVPQPLAAVQRGCWMHVHLYGWVCCTV